MAYKNQHERALEVGRVGIRRAETRLEVVVGLLIEVHLVAARSCALECEFLDDIAAPVLLMDYLLPGRAAHWPGVELPEALVHLRPHAGAGLLVGVGESVLKLEPDGWDTGSWLWSG